MRLNKSHKQDIVRFVDEKTIDPVIEKLKKKTSKFDEKRWEIAQDAFSSYMSEKEQKVLKKFDCLCHTSGCTFGIGESRHDSIPYKFPEKQTLPHHYSWHPRIKVSKSVWQKLVSMKKDDDNLNKLEEEKFQEIRLIVDYCTTLKKVLELLPIVSKMDFQSSGTSLTVINEELLKKVNSYKTREENE